MSDYVARNGLQVDQQLTDFVETEIQPGLDLTADHIWQGLSELIRDFAPRNRALLARRDDLQQSLDHWHRDHKDGQGYEDFLREIGYLLPEGLDFSIAPGEMDPEITHVAGPQLVVPVDNARFALNAANARWGSLFDALYGSDVILPPELNSTGYDRARGAKVIDYANDFMDRIFPLTTGRHGEAIVYHVTDQSGLRVSLKDGTDTGLRYAGQFVGFQGAGDSLRLLFVHHGLHVELRIDRRHPVGAGNLSGVCDIMVESALTAIMDCEDSVAAVDAADKVAVYRNWLGLMTGTLVAGLEKNGKTIERRLAPDRTYQAVDGGEITLPGRSLMLVRNVGHLMTTDAVLDAAGREIPEGILDALMTSLCALHDRGQNSRAGSIYIVKPKMHGPEEAAFANDLFDRVEDILGLRRYSIKIGVMDEERRTTLNLKECIRAVKNRIFFINTGFLDRTGDEIHSDMEAGPMVRKNAMKDTVWIEAYERWNVDIGLGAGLRGRAQIGKGMWAMPDEMARMMATKAAQLSAGASCAWVPSPTAATLHALHYHDIDVVAQQAALESRPPASLADLITLPILTDLPVSDADVTSELDNNCQSILGYVVRWIDQGVGCSKVPDINGTALMEDRATLRISSQHMANRLHHGICTSEQVTASLKRMAEVVDSQNSGDKNYINMAPDYDGLAFLAACDLVFKGRVQPNGYTEPLLHARRREVKAR